MGRESFYNKMEAASMSEAYRNACDEARDENGHQEGYSGDINATSGGYEDKTNHYNSSGLSLNDYIDKYKSDNTIGICLKKPKVNTNKIKSVVKHEVFKGTRKWELVYVVTTFGGHEIGSKDNKGDAVKQLQKM